MTPDQASNPESHQRADLLGGRLIIADDDQDMRWLVRTILGARFAEIVEAGDGRELIWHLMRSRRGRIAGGRPGLVVVADVRMPIYDGLQVLTAWQDGEPRVPLVVITSFPDEETRERAALLRAVFLAKPFTRASMTDAVAQAIVRISGAHE